MLWKRTTLSIVGKLQVFHAVIVSRLLYGLDSAWLNVAETRRLNGFYCRCLRNILGIQPSYISRVSNDTVLRRASSWPLHQHLLRDQLLLYGRVARAPESDLMKHPAFVRGTLRPAVQRYVRVVGRPRNEWTTMMRAEAAQMEMNVDVDSRSDWIFSVGRHCMRPRAPA